MTSFDSNNIDTPISKYQTLDMGVLPVSSTIVYQRGVLHKISLRLAGGTATLQLDNQTPVSLLDGDNIVLNYSELNSQKITIITDSNVNILYLIEKP